MSSMAQLSDNSQATLTGHPSARVPVSRVPADRPFQQPSRIVGRSPAMLRLMEQMERAIPHLRVGTIEGESGTGKRLVAAELHARGLASDGPLNAIHSSLFDSAKITTTGGMLLLERIDEMPANRQAMLLHFLRCRDSFTIEPSLAPLQVVVSSRRSVRALVAAGSLLPDLAYRLTAVRFYLAPLRERHEDIPVLAQLFLDRFAKKYRKPIQGLGTGTLARLFSHAWPGNVRELQSVLESAALEVEGQWIRPIDLVLTPPASPKPANSSYPETSLREDLSLDAATRRHVATVMSHTGGNKLRAAALLGISRSTLYRMLDQK